jgi:DNA repair protein RecO (recombination protein O)
MPGRGAAKQDVRSRALLLRRTSFGEADLVVSLFTEQAGAVAALARGARRSRRRFTGLEPMHELVVSLLVVPGRELATLTEARIARARSGLTGSLAALEAAGRALRWIRRAAVPRTPEPALWSLASGLLDALDARSDPERAEALLAASGLRMLAAAGWRLELARCVRCGRACPPEAAALLVVERGGLVCGRCDRAGAPGVRLAPETRRAMRAGGEASDVEAGADALASAKGAAALAVDLVERSLELHRKAEVA